MPPVRSPSSAPEGIESSAGGLVLGFHLCLHSLALAAAESLDQQAAADYIQLPCSDRRLMLQLTPPFEGLG
jgi:hypothetical protein